MTHPNGHPNGATPLTEAAVKLGLSTEVVRKRLTNGQMPGEKIGGRWYVFLTDQDADPDAHPNGHQDESGFHPDESYRLLSDAQREEIAFLRIELSARTEELRRKDIIIADLTQRLPRLAATTEGSDDPTERPVERVIAHPNGSQARSWWQFWKTI